MQYGWHFATREYYTGAMRDGAITAFALPHQNPVIWLSTARDWAPTIFERHATARRCLSFDEARERGLYGFGMAVSSLLTGRELRQKAKLSNSAWEQLLECVEASGADARRWFGHVGSLSIYDLIIDRYDGDRWMRLKRTRRVASVGLIALIEEPTDTSNGARRPGPGTCGWSRSRSVVPKLHAGPRARPKITPARRVHPRRRWR